MTWEGRQLVSHKNLADTLWTSYSYNSEGIRTYKRVSDVTSSTIHHIYNYTLDGTKILAQHYRNNKTKEDSYLYFLYDESGSVTGFNDGTNTYFYQKNIQGDIIRILDTNGNVVTEYTYDAWGKVLSVTGTLADTIGQKNPFRYRSYYYDSETGWYYLNSRYYDSEVGRFLNADDASLVGINGGIEGYNLFAYCNNSPIIYHDDQGYFLKSAIKWATSKIVEPVVNKIKDSTSNLNMTATFGRAFSFSPNIFTYGAQIGLTLDAKGNVAVQSSWSTGITIGSGIEVDSVVTVTNAPTYKELEGPGLQLGGGKSIPIPDTPVDAVVGGDFNMMFDSANNKCYQGYTRKMGIGYSNDISVNEAHIAGGNTKTIYHFNIYDTLNGLFKRIKRW